MLVACMLVVAEAITAYMSSKRIQRIMNGRMKN